MSADDSDTLCVVSLSCGVRDHLSFIKRSPSYQYDTGHGAQ